MFSNFSSLGGSLLDSVKSGATAAGSAVSSAGSAVGSAASSLRGTAPDSDLEHEVPPAAEPLAESAPSAAPVEPHHSDAESDKTEGPDSPSRETGPPPRPEPPKVPGAASDADAEAGGPAIGAQLNEVSGKAMDTAKEWGNTLFGFGSSMGSKIAESAKIIKDKVEEKTILGDFNKEQEKFIDENAEKSKNQEASVPPWVGYSEEEDMKKQILALSQDKRNFLRNPPAGVQFTYDSETSSPIAQIMLQEDTELEKMRFELVPSQVSEDDFWRNYFYRVSLIKQSAQLSSIAQHTDDHQRSLLGLDPISGKPSNEALLM